MKKITQAIALVIFSIFLFSTCSGSFLKTIKIKAKPKFRINIGSIEFKMEEYTSTEELNEELKKRMDGTNNLLTYSNGTNNKHTEFLLYHKIGTKEIDMSSYLSNIEEIGKEQDFPINRQEFTLPDLSSISKELPLPTADDLITKKMTLDATKIPNISLPSGTSIIKELPASFNLENCETLTFDEGSALEFNNTLPEGLEITEIQLIHGTDDKPKILLAKSSTAPFQIDLSNKTIIHSFSFKISFKATATVNNATAIIKPSFSNGTSIKEATGINIDAIEHDISDIEIPLTGINKLHSATVKSGSIKLETPAAWTGLTYKEGLTLKQDTIPTNASFPEAEGLSLTVNGMNIPLNDKKINSNTIKLGGKVKIKIENGTYTKQANDAENTNLKATIEISEFSEVKIKTEDLNLSIDKEISVNASLKNKLEEVKFNKDLLTVTLNSKLPEGKKFKLTLSSDDLHKATATGTALSETIAFNETETTSKQLPAEAYILTNTDLNDDKIKFTAKASLDNISYNDTTKLLSITNLSTNDTGPFFFEGNVKMKPDWEYVKIKAEDVKFEATKDINLQNVKTHVDKVKAKGIKPIGLEANIYIYSPDIDNLLSDKSLEFEAKLHIEEGVNKWVFQDNEVKYNPTPEKNSVIKFTTSLPTELETAKQYTGNLPEASVKYKLDGIFDHFPNNSAKFKYNIKAKDDSITITKDVLDKIKNNDNNLKIYTALIFRIPMKLKVDNTNCELYKKNAEADILGRIQGDDKKNKVINESLDLVEDLSLNLDYDNTALYGTEKAIITGPDSFEKEVQFSNGYNQNVEFKLTKEEIEKIKNNIPFKPSIKILLPKGEYGFNQKGKIKATLYLLSQMNIEKEFKQKK